MVSHDHIHHIPSIAFLSNKGHVTLYRCPGDGGVVLPAGVLGSTCTTADFLQSGDTEIDELAHYTTFLHMVYQLQTKDVL